MNNVSKRRAFGAIAGFSAIALAFGTAIPAQASATELKIGAVFPLTGALSFLSAPQVAGFTLAVEEINAAGGVLGKKVSSAILDEADGTQPTVALASATKHIANKVDLIIGAASSGRSSTMIAATSAAKVVQISGSNTAISLTTLKDDGFYFRTAPSDLLQGRVLANQVLQDGASKVAILWQDTPYGVGLNSQAKAVLEKGKATVESISFPEGETNVTSFVDKALAGKPDAIIIISYAESKRILPALQAKGFSGGNVYLVDGNLVDYSKDSFAEYLNGAKGTKPAKAVNARFKSRLEASYKKSTGKTLTETTYAESVYDAVILGALAAQAAKSATGTGIKSQITNVSRAGAGKVTVTSYAAGLKALKAGKQINYDGQSGTIEFDRTGDPTGAFIGIFRYSADGQNKLVRSILGSTVK
jgi:branched-chain amino acid transport system substrate-binding protein